MPGVVGARKSVSPVAREREWPSKSMSRPSSPYSSMILPTEETKVSRAAVVGSWT